MHAETLGPYEIRREWGRSALGRVLLARDSRTGGDVSIQLIESLSGQGDSERTAAWDRLRRDCGAVTGLKHPNLLAVLDVGVEGDLHYVVTEWVDGTPFAVFGRPDSLLATSAVIDLVAGAARGLDELHRTGVVHGNVQPESLLRVDGAGMVAGIGLAHCLPPAEDSQLRGAPHCLSPEQVRGEQLDGRSDVFSLATVLHEMLTGRRAFPGQSIPTVLYRIVNEEVDDPSEREPGVHAAIAGVLLRALAKRPNDRFDSGALFAEALETAGVEACVDESIVPERVSGPDSEPVAQDRATRRSAPPARTSPRRMSARPFVLGGILLVALAAVVVWTFRGGGDGEIEPVPWLETLVRTEPPGIEPQLDGEPIEPGANGTIRFAGRPPFGLLTASQGCRTAEHRLDPADAGGEVVLVVDPVETEVPVDPSLDGARVLLNGDPAGETPAQVVLDLCRANRLEVRAEGYHTAAVEIPSGATPLEARTLVYTLALEPIPRGRLILPRERGLQLVYFVDGRRIGKSVGDLELEEGAHTLRYKNEYHWIDVTTKVNIGAGETTTPPVDPRFATLAVQAFPSNCKVFLRKPGGTWKYLDETPAQRRVATGRYEIKVQLNPTGESRVTRVDLSEGVNPPVRVAFGGER
jgi:hypothetical protein